MSESALLTKQDLPEILQRYASGESLQEIAKESRTHVRTLYRWMLGGIGDANYHELVTDCLVNRVAEADEKLAEGSDACHIARAREMARFARMDLERRRPHLYGPKQEIKHDTSITVHVHRSTPQPVVVEAVRNELSTVVEAQVIDP